MPILINDLVTSLDQPAQAAVEEALRLLGVPPQAVESASIAKTSLDARRRGNVHFVHSVSVRLYEGEEQAVRRAASRRVVLRREEPLEVKIGERPLEHRPVIAGFGPAGMFAGLLLAKNGYRPVILERGACMERRVQAVEAFWRTGVLDPATNVQFGEGGAGTFSDGKLTTRIGDPKCSYVLRELVRFGAPPEILHRQKPHIGTDRLRGVVRAIRQEILRLGGEVRFETPLLGLDLRDGALRAVELEGGWLPAQALVLATGHSARDTFQMLLDRGLALEPKPFSVGVRIEHLQSQIDRGLYGALAGHPALPVGEYQLSHRVGEQGVYTFCMCPGGRVVPAASEEGRVVTNGMSYFARDGQNANAALVVGVAPAQYGSHPLDGVALQRRLEEAAFRAGGGGYRAPAQDVGSFLAGKPGLRLGRVAPTYALGVTGCDFGALFPQQITGMLQLGLRVFGRKLPGFDGADGVLTGVETRTSSPVRILRGENFQAPGAAGLYPCAEGAGYAGGIMSAAVDGLRTALALMAAWAPPKG